MTTCRDEGLGQLLHDFELGLLSDADRHRFELHLYDCEHCLAEVRRGLGVSQTLKTDADVDRLIREVGGEEGDTPKQEVRKTPIRFSRFLMAAVLMVGVAAPVYWLALDRDGPTSVQHLELLSARSGGSDVIYLERGGDVTIDFFVGDAVSGPVSLYIARVAGDTVVVRRDFTDIDEQGLGTISLPVSPFSAGHYVLSVTKAVGEAEPQEMQYFFRVK